ncbi:hypothetical protein Pla144_43870 [Bythopirellula polymerisocia]|uniref:Uncharacterized protein n=1 Tax=Bythopirellula polymerisocia TaxID=2528003 RepID=A0A5C6CBB5_9BACT|nr:hypothetical protein Pla144_43870 [Bythopirellula polymerisocia]
MSNNWPIKNGHRDPSAAPSRNRNIFLAETRRHRDKRFYSLLSLRLCERLSSFQMTSWDIVKCIVCKMFVRIQIFQTLVAQRSQSTERKEFSVLSVFSVAPMFQSLLKLYGTGDN